MVLSVKKTGITQKIGVVSDYTYSPPPNFYSSLNPAKYPTATAQLDTSTVIPPGDDTYCENGY